MFAQSCFFSNSGTKTQLFLSCLQFWALSDSPTAHQSPLGDQIAYTVGHGAPGTFELMNYHLLHVFKCHCRFMLLKQHKFRISATTPSQHFSILLYPRQLASLFRVRDFRVYIPKPPLAQWLQAERVFFVR